MDLASNYYWFLTSTTYGTWLPGDERGCITRVRDYRAGDVSPPSNVASNVIGSVTPPKDPNSSSSLPTTRGVNTPRARVLHNQVGTPYDRDLPGLKRSAQAALKCPPIYLILEQAEALLAQFQETACYRQWDLLAVALMANHFHIVNGAPRVVLSSDILGDFKGYGSRALSRRWGKPASGTWWTESGSKRWLKTESAIRRRIQYIRDQEYPLVIWVKEGF